MSRLPIKGKHPGLRQRERADGSFRVWWEPSAAARALGFTTVELTENSPKWSADRARELSAEVKAAINGEDQPKIGVRNISWLIKAYRGDAMFKDLKPKTQDSYQKLLNIIDPKWGAHAVTGFDKPTMRAWYRTNFDARGQTMAVRLNAMMSILFTFAELEGWRPEGSNPCHKLKIATPKGRDREASWDEIFALLDTAEDLELPSIGTACLMSLLAGQRETDILAARVQDFERVTFDGPEGEEITVWAWRVDRSKRGNQGLLQLHPVLVERIEPQLLAQAPADLLLRDERTGQPFTEQLFISRFRTVRKQAAKAAPSILGNGGAATLQFRDLRRTFAIQSRTGGASEVDASDALGNSAARNPRLRKTYMPAQFHTARRAVLAIEWPERKGRKKA